MSFELIILAVFPPQGVFHGLTGLVTNPVKGMTNLRIFYLACRHGTYMHIFIKSGPYSTLLENTLSSHIKILLFC